jgi:hypothetical protein
MKLTEAQRGDILRLNQFAIEHGLKWSPERIAEHLGVPAAAACKLIAGATPKRRGRPPLPRDADGKIIRPAPEPAARSKGDRRRKAKAA